jgi:hypothetical protein
LDPTLVTYGTIDLVRAIAVELTYLKAFFDFVFLEKKDKKFKKPGPVFREIRIAGYSSETRLASDAVLFVTCY